MQLVMKILAIIQLVRKDITQTNIVYHNGSAFLAPEQCLGFQSCTGTDREDQTKRRKLKKVLNDGFCGRK